MLGWWQSFFVIAWCWLVPGGGGFCFQVKRVLHVFCACGVVGVDETKASCGLFGFIGCKGFAGQILFVFWF